jgi:DNA-binding transcriptional LysR family regulator
MAPIGDDITLHHLRCVVAVADLGSATSAAQWLGISQPTLSHQVSTLEGRLETKLFRRRSRGMVATPTGAHFIADAREILRLTNEAVTAARRGTADGSSTLTVGVLTSLATSIIPEAVARWRQLRPDVGLRLREELRRSDLEAAVRAGDVDLAVGAAPLDWQGAIEGVGDEELVLVIPPADRRSGSPSVDLSSLADAGWALYDEDHGLLEPVLRACAAAGFQPRPVVRTRQVDTAVQLAAAGIGVTIAPRASIPGNLQALASHCRPPLHSPVAVWSLRPTHPHAGLFAAVVRRSFESRPDQGHS